ncbi:uncharacterized protein LOC130903377 [Diorhabda carinulata]|uniref:uncharacterized protein LOC130903377 n=1 Tax=Diorhabda carinulata TaxID=1163345 RepID=UPI0025A04C2F|nr:uncharacterized protein LOC130903377 [Diorhabda carinulata]
MVALIGVVIGFMLIIFNDEIFQYSPPPPGPLVSSYLFLLALFLLLCELEVYPASLRKLGTIFQNIIEMFIAAFIAEIIIVGFWFPLEANVMRALEKSADVIEELVWSDNYWNCDTLCNILRSRIARYVVSYMLSAFFLIIVLHASRAIDLRALDEGVDCFINDIVFRVKRNIKRQIKKLTNPKYTEDISDRVEDQLIRQLVNGTCSDDLTSLNGTKLQTTQNKKRRRSSRIKRTKMNGGNGEGDDYGNCIYD